MSVLAILGASSGSSGIGGGIGLLFFFLVYIVVIVLYVAGMWKMFEKAGQKGWYALIPILNIYILVKLSGKEMYWLFIWIFCCFLSFIAGIVVFMELAPKYGKSPAYGIGMALLPFIFIPLLGFSDAEYTGDKTPLL